MKYLGIDHGQVRTGIAVSDPDGKIAFPRKTLSGFSEKELIAEIARIVNEEAVDRIVMGIPLDVEGKPGKEAENVKRIARKLSGAAKVRIIEWDERFTTSQVLTSLKKSGVKTGSKRDVIDQSAAALILQSYLDGINAG